ILASNDLDEYKIDELLKAGAPIDLFGVGTRLATGFGESALSGVYKMAAIEKDGKLIPKMKISDEISKGTIPSRKNVYRYYDSDNTICFDLICQDEETVIKGNVYDIKGNKFTLDGHMISRCMHVPIFHNGTLVYDTPTLQEIRHYCYNNMQSLTKSIKDIYDPVSYEVYISPKLFSLLEKMRLSISDKKGLHYK
ncbi:MAG TPA: nicotinate phosphoribosyltransferase, partial [Spirochaetota bacterium]|nr:nicotinate phosphoribosyltransferase [Spirochaetota bacterium]